MWAELRCPACIAAGRYSKILCKFTAGSIASTGEVVVQCKCGEAVRLTAGNQHGDRVATFVSTVTSSDRPAFAARR